MKMFTDICRRHKKCTLLVLKMHTKKLMLLFVHNLDLSLTTPI